MPLNLGDIELIIEPPEGSEPTLVVSGPRGPVGPVGPTMEPVLSSYAARTWQTNPFTEEPDSIYDVDIGPEFDWAIEEYAPSAPYGQFEQIRTLAIYESVPAVYRIHLDLTCPSPSAGPGIGQQWARIAIYPDSTSVSGNLPSGYVWGPFVGDPPGMSGVSVSVDLPMYPGDTVRLSINSFIGGLENGSIVTLGITKLSPLVDS